MASSGLEGVVAATTQLSHVDGERGELVIAGYRVDDLAEHATFEETTWLLWHGDLPSAAQLDAFRGDLAAARVIPDDDPRAAPRVRPSRSSTRWTRCASPPGRSRSSPTRRRASSRAFRRSSPRTGGCGADRSRLRRGRDLGHAANFLYMLSGDVPDPERVRGLETYLNTVIDHGLNASTFTARVITSTGSDLVSAVVGALGALKGPLHGGAPGPALDMVFEIGDAVTRRSGPAQEDRGGEKLMGFGHRVYKVRDPRADVLAKAAERMFTRAGDMSLYTLARSVEAEALRLLEDIQARSTASDQRGVLHGAAPPRPRIRRAAVHADVRGQPRERMDRPRVRAATRESHHPAPVGVRGSARSEVGAAADIELFVRRRVCAGQGIPPTELIEGARKTSRDKC